jgi:hypothetical protein
MVSEWSAVDAKQAFNQSSTTFTAIFLPPFQVNGPQPVLNMLSICRPEAWFGHGTMGTMGEHFSAIIELFSFGINPQK